MAKVLITGGGGFIGAHLARRLHGAGYQVDVVEDFSRAVPDKDFKQLLEQPGIRLIEQNLLYPGALDDADTDYDSVFHLAAIVGVASVLRRPYDVLNQNVVLLLNVLRLAERQKALRRFVFPSTSEIYAGTLEAFGIAIPTPESAPITVPDVRLPRTSYMLSKLYGEALCLQSELPATVVRPHNFYGPRMGLSHVIPELLQRAHAAPDGGELEVFSPDHRRTFCFIEDAVEMLKLAAESEACAGEVLNVGRQQPEIRMDELARLILEVVGRDLELVSGPSTPGSPARRAPDMAKATQLLGYRPVVELEEGVRRTYDWYVENVFARSGVGPG